MLFCLIFDGANWIFVFCQVLPVYVTKLMKKVLREMQTLNAGYSKAEPKNFAPPQTPFSGGTGRPKFNQLQMVTTFTFRPSLVKMDAHNFELAW